MNRQTRSHERTRTNPEPVRRARAARRGLRRVAPGYLRNNWVSVTSLVVFAVGFTTAAVLRPLRPPHRLLTILEGESLLNDASALLIYRLAVGAVATNRFSLAPVAPAFLLAVAGSLAAGPALRWLVLRLTKRIQHVPTAIILQFVSTFGVWLLAEGFGLSGVLTMVCYAMTDA